ncbi:MAG TPA: hypothetical protein VHZ55_25475 [Bryobacteraceae bacterium]|jgi:hypothetical protein|nr:hypothetical protein [Bryobacteraceae bacterium]
MTSSILVFRWILRIGFLLSLILGVVLWTGHGTAYLRLHMWVGFLITFDLLLLVVLSFLSGVRPALPLISLIWAIALPVIGIAQLNIMPGSSHWVIQVVHVVFGLGAIGLGEVLSKKALLRQPS